MNKDTNEVGFNFLMEEFKPIVKNIAKKYFTQTGEHEDLVQEGMIGLFKALRNYDETKNSKFKPFAILCIEREIISKITKDGRKKQQILSNRIDLDKLISMERLGESNSDPLGIVIENEENAGRYRKIEETLTELETNVLNLYLEEKKYDEIAAALDISSKKVDNTLLAIKKKLKN